MNIVRYRVVEKEFSCGGINYRPNDLLIVREERIEHFYINNNNTIGIIMPVYPSPKMLDLIEENTIEYGSK